MQHEIFRETLDGDNGYYVYTWNKPRLFQMRWNYSIEWETRGKPSIWIHSYRCWQRATTEDPWKEVEDLPFDIPMSDSILRQITQHAAQQLYSRSVVVGSMKRVPRNFLSWAEEAAGKGYDIKLLREMAQREAAKTSDKDHYETAP